jgi:hypothetical protein
LSQSAGVPGTPIDRPEETALAKFIGVPSGLVKVVGVKVAGAVSRPSIVVTLPALAS